MYGKHAFWEKMEGGEIVLEDMARYFFFFFFFFFFFLCVCVCVSLIFVFLQLFSLSPFLPPFLLFFFFFSLFFFFREVVAQLELFNSYMGYYPRRVDGDYLFYFYFIY